MVGVITLVNAMQYNYGGVLQNYALVTYLKRAEIPVQPISCSAFSLLGACRVKAYTAFHIRMTKKGGWKFHVVDTQTRIRDAKFDAFLRESIRPKQYTWYRKRVYQDIVSTCDRVIVGSDQVWNPYLAVGKKTGKAFLLSFLPPEKRISYAASFGVSQLPEAAKSSYQAALREYRAISVREDAGQRIVEKLTGRTDVQVLVDPVMLLTKKDWDAVAKKPKHPLPGKYLLMYFLGEMPRERIDAINGMAKAHSWEIIELTDPADPHFTSDPGEFLYLISHAALVCTDSFHASAFSFLYQRPLAIFERLGKQCDMESRLQTLVSKFHLEHCLVQGERLPDIPAAPDYSAGYAALETERSKAAAFLINACGGQNVR